MKVKVETRKAILMCAAIVMVLIVLPFGLMKGCDRFVGNAPIVFYGKVTDQTGAAIAGVNVSAEITTNDRFQIPVPFSVKRHRTAINVQTNRQGRFEIHHRGTSLQIVGLDRPGWVVVVDGNTKMGFGYPSLPSNPAPTDPDAPIVYVMKELEEAK